MFIAVATLPALPSCTRCVLIGSAVDSDVYKRTAITPFVTEGTASAIGSQLADEVTLRLLEKAPQTQIVESTRIKEASPTGFEPVLPP
jgi:hypothetical protein